MSMPVRHLPVLQNWDCQSCAECCREYVVSVTEEEKQRIESQGWCNAPEYQHVTLITNDGSNRRPRYRLAHRPDGGCVFLDERNRCRIHERFGSSAKPLACRVYPFMLVPAGDHWRVGMRFACPSVAENRGRRVSEHLSELRGYVAGLETNERIPATLPPPRLQPGQSVEWQDVLRFVAALCQLMSERTMRVERRLRRCLALARICRHAKFDKVAGSRLKEFLEIVSAALDDEAPPSPENVSPPSWIGRVLFRQMVALFARKDTGQYSGVARQGRLALLSAAFRFARGAGPVPRVHALLPAVQFEQLEEPLGELPQESERLLERYFVVKIGSLQFAGKTNFRLPFWEGLESLALVFPAMMWMTRAFATVIPIEDAVQRALRIADDNFGFHPLLGSARQRLALRILSFRDEIMRLVAWYGR